MTEQAVGTQQTAGPGSHELLRGVIQHLLSELKKGAGDKEKRRYVEEWMRGLSEKFPEFSIREGLRDYYLSEAERLRGEFDSATELTEKLGIARSIETYLDKAADYGSHDSR
ncbi:MAG: hypothetical protein ACYC7A_12015 [Thermoanaerobaculia bacterium]